jgi:hypothetical protein
LFSTSDISSTNGTLIFELLGVALETDRKPTGSVITALAKIGGLFALLRISFLLNWWHKFLFEKEMNSCQ